MRTGGIVEALSRELDVTLVEPFWGEDEHKAALGTWAPPGVERISIPGAPRPGALRHFADLRPRLGLDALDAAGRRRLRDIVERVAPRVVLYGQSYIAAAAPPFALPLITDFQNVESHRLRSIAAVAQGIHRASALWEYAKAEIWERRVARQSTFSLAVSPDDAALISKWGGDVVVVPNAPPAVDPWPLARRGHGALRSERPVQTKRAGCCAADRERLARVRERVAHAELHVVGTGTDERLGRFTGDSVRIAGQVADLRSHYEAQR